MANYTMIKPFLMLMGGISYSICSICTMSLTATNITNRVAISCKAGKKLGKGSFPKQPIISFPPKTGEGTAPFHPRTFSQMKLC